MLDNEADELIDLVKDRPFDFFAAMLDAELSIYKNNRTPDKRRNVISAAVMMLAKNSLEEHGKKDLKSKIAIYQNAIKYFSSQN